MQWRPMKRVPKIQWRPMKRVRHRGNALRRRGTALRGAGVEVPEELAVELRQGRRAVVVQRGEVAHLPTETHTRRKFKTL